MSVLGAALCYSLTTVRIGFHAARLSPLQLALAKSTGLAALSAGAPDQPLVPPCDALSTLLCRLLARHGSSAVCPREAFLQKYTGWSAVFVSQELVPGEECRVHRKADCRRCFPQSCRRLRECISIGDCSLWWQCRMGSDCSCVGGTAWAAVHALAGVS